MTNSKNMTKYKKYARVEALDLYRDTFAFTEYRYGKKLLTMHRFAPGRRDRSAQSF